MATILMGNVSVIEEVKKDPDLDASPDNVIYVKRDDLGKRTTSFQLNEVDINDKESREMNSSMAKLLWAKHSDKPPAWVDGNDELLVALLADYYGCPIGQPKSWKEG